MDKKNKIEPSIDFCEAVDNQMEANKESYAKIREERILKNDSLEQVNLKKKLTSKGKRTTILKNSNRKYYGTNRFNSNEN